MKATFRFATLLLSGFCACLVLAASPAPSPQPAGRCGAALRLGYRVRSFEGGLKAALWYPTLAEEADFGYPLGHRSRLAPESPIAACGSYPLVVFSHGFDGCGTQLVYFTEELARHGYVVVAPDHRDSGCKVDRAFPRFRIRRAETAFRSPGEWSDKNFADRRDDVLRVVRELLSNPELGPRIDPGRLGIAGHSLGGYTALGLAGGWSAWKDSRFRAVAVFSPYAQPFVFHGGLGGISAPLMFQGGTRDIYGTLAVKRVGGAFDSARAPKIFVELEGAGHFVWSMLQCGRGSTIAECLAANRDGSPGIPALVNRYAIAFFDTYLKGASSEDLGRKLQGVAELRFVPR
jgi:dienelactone hydrolase